MKKYYVIQTKAKQEQKAVINLERQGFKTWYPTFKKTVFFKNKEKIVKEPLFPTYIFVIVDLIKDDWSKIHSTLGVRHLITISGKPQEIKKSNIILIRDILNGATLNLNDKVKIISGKLINKTGRITELCSHDRVKILLESLSGKITAILTRGLLNKV
tara:strand:- start:999 stop:1472 length:474 start_codon:yes stop_codon:yes gene_type:complete